MKIYLAGKIAKGDWRHDVVAGLRHANSYFDAGTDEWPILENAILRRHDYTGPFFVGCDHGCYHGKDTHGYKGGCCGPECDDVKVSRLCRKALDVSDVVFAWIDAPDAYGTIFEIGYAIAKGTNVYLGISSALKNRSDLWFIAESLLYNSDILCNVVYKKDAKEALESFYSDWYLREDS
jgi:hypothetical protein